jgi:hypothetical protein
MIPFLLLLTMSAPKLPSAFYCYRAEAVAYNAENKLVSAAVEIKKIEVPSQAKSVKLTWTPSTSRNVIRQNILRALYVNGACQQFTTLTTLDPKQNTYIDVMQVEKEKQ